jgi:hypothetical protein
MIFTLFSTVNRRGTRKNATRFRPEERLPPCQPKRVFFRFKGVIQRATEFFAVVLLIAAAILNRQVAQSPILRPVMLYNGGIASTAAIRHTGGGSLYCGVFSQVPCRSCSRPPFSLDATTEFRQFSYCEYERPVSTERGVSRLWHTFTHKQSINARRNVFFLRGVIRTPCSGVGNPRAGGLTGGSPRGIICDWRCGHQGVRRSCRREFP